MAVSLIPRRLRAAKQRQIDHGGTEFSIRGKVIARLYWHATGTLEWATYFDREGRRHGVERVQFEDERLKYLARWSAGRQVGWQQQWSETGKLLVRTRFLRGSGLDAWFDNGLSETRTLVDGHRHGFERLWIGRGLVWSESHFEHGVEHGIARQWTAAGRLERGSPRFWIGGNRVTRRQYERAAAHDKTLPPIRELDDKPKRKAPKVIE